MPPVKKEEERRDGAVQTGKYINPIAPARHYRRIQAGDPPSLQGNCELIGHGVTGTGSRNQ